MNRKPPRPMSGLERRVDAEAQRQYADDRRALLEANPEHPMPLWAAADRLSRADYLRSAQSNVHRIKARDDAA